MVRRAECGQQRNRLRDARQPISRCRDLRLRLWWQLIETHEHADDFKEWRGLVGLVAQDDSHAAGIESANSGFTLASNRWALRHRMGCLEQLATASES
jgi:hypothetical protein